MRKIKIYLICLIYSFFLIFLMDGLISYLLFDGGLEIDSLVFWANVGLTFLISCFIITALGEGLGGLALFLLTLVLVIGNLIKLIYHDTILKPADFALISELIEIGSRFVMPWEIGMLIIGAVILIVLIFKFRKVIVKALISRPMPLTALVFLLLIIGCNFLIDGSNSKLDSKTRISSEGFMVFNFINAREITSIYPEAPEGYGEEKMTELKAEFDSIGSEVSEVKPDVIVILLESYFDIGEVEGFGLSRDITKYSRNYETAGLISPRYGGGTASTEFEVLTGFSSAFLPDGVIPYNVYMKSGDKEVPSIVREFGKNGYKTTAVHPSTASCYSRDKAFAELGFDEFLTIEDFDVTEEDMTVDKMTKDFKVKEKIQELLDNSQEPEFIFAITFESHCPYMNKYDEEDIDFTAEGENLSERNKKEVLQYARCAMDTSLIVKELAEYIDERERPTLLLCFGDHLPPLGGFRAINYLDDLYTKYGTPVFEYSNYKESKSFGTEYVSPSFLAAHILREAETEHSSYFDFIDSLTASNPILNIDFGIDYEDENIKKYQLLQYDLFFGEKYLEE
ncbi:MAG: LTA synthase family protein [Eubacterium sp.]|nr:LTA synthase family protein [Eubacterium sp.]